MDQKSRGIGAGKALVAECVRRARENGSKRIFVFTCDWMPGISFLFFVSSIFAFVSLSFRCMILKCTNIFQQPLCSCIWVQGLYAFLSATRL